MYTLMRFSATLALFFVSSLFATVPQLMNYQGSLKDSSGNPLNAAVSIKFTIYDAAALGNAVWTETQSGVKVDRGVFRVLLGTVTPIGESVFNDSTRYLGVQVGSDPEMKPRTRIGSVGYSQRVGTIDGANGGQSMANFL